MQLQPVILSGGSGSRLWPLSRETYPKQFLPLTSEHTMLQETVRRLDGLDNHRQALQVLDPLVVCNEAHRFLVAEQLRFMGRRAGAILLEPSGRNTAPALTLAALNALEQGPDPVLLVMPADHSIADEPEFQRRVSQALDFADQGAVITFGIVPAKPETGYGYLRQGAAYPDPDSKLGVFHLDRFVEKPDLATAQQYLDDGGYCWNSGIFILKARIWLDLIAGLRPDIADAAGRAYRGGHQEAEFFRLDTEAFKACPSDSIDYAVMERLTDTGAPGLALMLPLDAGWTDLGAWSALWEARVQDEFGNVLEGDAFVHDARDNLLIAQHRMLAVVGLNNLVVVETPDAVLVVSKDRAQDVKAVTQHLEREQRQELRQHRRCHRPWGSFEPIDMGARYQVKRLTVAPHQALSLQMHLHRAEHWVVVTGTARVTCEDKVFLLTENQSAYIPVGARHRLENPGTIPLEIIEVQSGGYLGEDDIVRFEDAYRRDTAAS